MKWCTAKNDVLGSCGFLNDHAAATDCLMRFCLNGVSRKESSVEEGYCWYNSDLEAGPDSSGRIFNPAIAELYSG